MSKLADRIRRASKLEPAPLGFAAAARQKTASLLIIVRLSSNEAGKAAEAASKGADAVIIEGVDAGKAQEAVGKGEPAAVGVRLQKADRRAVSGLREAGADFVALDPGTAMADAMLEEKIGYVLPADPAAEDTSLRLLGDLGLDALIVPAPDRELTVEKLLQLRRVATLARTPLLTEVRHDADASLLQALRDSNVAGVIVDSGAIGKLEGLRSRILELPERGRRKEEKAEALLPVGIGAAHGDEQEEDDE